MVPPKLLLSLLHVLDESTGAFINARVLSHMLMLLQSVHDYKSLTLASVRYYDRALQQMRQHLEDLETQVSDPTFVTRLSHPNPPPGTRRPTVRLARCASHAPSGLQCSGAVCARSTRTCATSSMALSGS